MAFRWSWNTTAPMRSPSGLQVEALAPEREVQHVEQGNDEPRDEPRRGMLRRHPLAIVGVLILLLVALPAGYLYCDYTSHFESTDDAFIARASSPSRPRCPLTSRRSRSPITSTSPPAR